MAVARMTADREWQMLSQSASGIPATLRRDGRPVIPVYDDAVRCAVCRPKDFWMALHSALRQTAANCWLTPQT
jgi:hypothetical protein